MANECEVLHRGCVPLALTHTTLHPRVDWGIVTAENLTQLNNTMIPRQSKNPGLPIRSPGCANQSTSAVKSLIEKYSTAKIPNEEKKNK